MVVRPYRIEEFQAVLNSNAFSSGEKSRNRLIFALQATMGPRIHEALALTCGDVWESRHKLKSRIWFKKTKNGLPRTIEIPPDLNPFFYSWQKVLIEWGLFLKETPLFCRRNGVVVSRYHVYRLYQKAHKELNLSGLGTHSARKTWATNTHDFWVSQMRQGMNIDPLAMTAKLGGWKDINSCSRYIGLDLYNMNLSQNFVSKKLLGQKSAQNLQFLQLNAEIISCEQ
jgi:integrase